MAEFLDVLDGDGNPTGMTAEKDDAHARGLWHRAAYVWIINPRGEILMQQRSPRKDYPGWWVASASGHVSAGEAPEAAALREAKEELGISLSESQLKFIRAVKIDEWKRFVYVFVVELDFAIEKCAVRPEEVQAVKYIPWQELSRLTKEELIERKIWPHPEYGNLFRLLIECCKSQDTTCPK